MANVKILSFDLDGIPRMLSGMEEIEAAHADGKIGPETDVTIYFDDNSRNFAPAGKQDSLSRLFAPQADSELEPGPEPAPPLPPPSGISQEPDEYREQEEIAAQAALEPIDQNQAAAEPLQNDLQQSDSFDPITADEFDIEPKTRNGSIAVGIVLILVFGGFALFSGNGAKDEFAADAFADSEADMDVAADSIEDSSDAMEDVLDPIGQLDSSTAGEFRMLRASTLFLRPDGISNGTIRIGQKVFVDGTVDGYAQLTTEDGKLGYALWEDINGNPYLDRTYRIQVVNNCSITKSFLLIWRENSEWQIDASNKLSIQGNRSWILAKGAGMEQHELEVDTLEIYYYPIDDNVRRARSFYPDSRKSVTIDDRSEKMLTAIPDLSTDGLATITFSPPDC